MWATLESPVPGLSLVIPGQVTHNPFYYLPQGQISPQELWIRTAVVHSLNFFLRTHLLHALLPALIRWVPLFSVTNMTSSGSFWCISQSFGVLARWSLIGSRELPGRKLPGKPSGSNPDVYEGTDNSEMFIAFLKD